MTRRNQPEFWSNVRKTGTCWLWDGALSSAGYGIFGARGYAHRMSYEHANGAIPDGLEIDHLCRVRNCINPAHLEAVPPRINQLRGQTIGGRNANKTHCDSGHEFNESNTYWRKDRPWRQCKACYAEKARLRRARVKVAQ